MKKEDKIVKTIEIGKEEYEEALKLINEKYN